MDRNRDRRLLAGIRLRILLAATLAATGCTTQWSLESTKAGIALQWPWQPAPAKVTFVEALTGFHRHGGTGSVLRDIAIGRDDRDEGSFLLPVAVATGADGRIAVADLGRRCVHLYVPSSGMYECLRGSASEKILSPVGLAFGRDSRLFVTDSTGGLFAFGPDGRSLFVIHSAGTVPLERPTGLAYSPVRDLLYVVDTVAHRIHALHPDGTAAFSFGRRGDGNGELNFPTHLFRSAAGELFVTDALNFRVQIFDESGEPIGGFGRHGDGSGDLAMPKGIAVDRAGTVYLVDGIFDNVQLFERSGAFLLTLGRRGTGLGEMWLPSGAFLDGSGRLYVCDTYNRRIQVFRISEDRDHE